MEKKWLERTILICYINYLYFGKVQEIEHKIESLFFPYYITFLLCARFVCLGVLVFAFLLFLQLLLFASALLFVPPLQVLYLVFSPFFSFGFVCLVLCSLVDGFLLLDFHICSGF